MGFWGQNAYIFLEISDDEIADGAVVATWATVIRPEEFTTTRDPFTGETTTTKVETGVPYVQTETVECAVVYHSEPPSDAFKDASGDVEQRNIGGY